MPIYLKQLPLVTIARRRLWRRRNDTKRNAREKREGGHYRVRLSWRRRKCMLRCADRHLRLIKLTLINCAPGTSIKLFRISGVITEPRRTDSETRCETCSLCSWNFLRAKHTNRNNRLCLSAIVRFNALHGMRNEILWFSDMRISQGQLYPCSVSLIETQSVRYDERNYIYL